VIINLIDKNTKDATATPEVGNCSLMLQKIICE